MNSIVIWAVILVISLVVEGMTGALVSIWFVPSALLCIVLELVGVTNLYIQFAIFIVSTIIFAYLMRNKIKESLNKDKTKTNTDVLIGKTAIVEEDIVPDSVGRVKINGMSWAAVSSDEKTILAGGKVKILAIDGVKLICEPKGETLNTKQKELV